MDRRKFIHGITLASAGALVLPGLRLSAMGTATMVELSPVHAHVRHGLFNTVQPPLVEQTLTDSISSLQRNRFYKNGYSPDNDDPYSVSIETNKGQNLQLFLQGDSVNCYLDSLPLSPQTKNCYRADNLQVQVIYIAAGKTQTINLKGKKTFFVAIEGQPKVGTSTLKDNLGLVLENKDKIEIQSPIPAKVLLITEV